MSSDEMPQFTELGTPVAWGPKRPMGASVGMYVSALVQLGFDGIAMDYLFAVNTLHGTAWYN